MSEIKSKDAFRKTLGENIRLARKAAGVTQQEIVKHVSVNRPTWSKVEQGQCGVRVEVLAEFCVAVGADPTSLIPLKINGSTEGENTNSIKGALRTIARGRALVDVGVAAMARLVGVRDLE